MKEKDTKKQQKISFDNLIEQEEKIIYVTESIDYILRDKLVGNGEMQFVTLKFIFNGNNLVSNINIRLVLEGKGRYLFKIFVVTPQGVDNIESKLDMRALVLNPGISIEFVPILEIDEKDVSVDHKSAVGRPDEQILQYLRSRGLDEPSAISMISDAYLKT